MNQGNVIIARPWSAGNVARTGVDLMTCGFCFFVVVVFGGGGLQRSSGRRFVARVLHQSHGGLAPQTFLVELAGLFKRVQLMSWGNINIRHYLFYYFLSM